MNRAPAPFRNVCLPRLPLHRLLLCALCTAAPGGAYDYLVRGHMIGGFAAVAYPVSYGTSGVMSFLINHDGVVYQKDLGPETTRRASQMLQFNPDASWTKLP